MKYPYERSSRSGFTLLEMCIVLCLIALFLTAATFQISTALEEQHIREDASRLSFLIRAGMLRAQDENTEYLLTINEHSASLAKVKSSDESGETASTDTAMFHPDNQLWVPQDKHQPWVHLEHLELLFQSGELSPIDGKVRWTHGSSYLEQKFDPLTAEVEGETSSFQ